MPACLDPDPDLSWGQDVFSRTRCTSSRQAVVTNQQGGKSLLTHHNQTCSQFCQSSFNAFSRKKKRSSVNQSTN